MPESTSHRISKMIMKEAVEDKKMELMQTGMKLPDNDADVLSLFNTSELYGLINDGIKQFSSKSLKNEDITAIMKELKPVERPHDPLGSSNPKSALHWVSKEVTKQAVEDKKAELRQSGMQIPAKDIDILHLIDTSYLYGLINDGINAYNDSHTTQITSIFDNTNTATVVDTNNKTTTNNKASKTKPVVLHENNNGSSGRSTVFNSFIIAVISSFFNALEEIA